LIEEFGGSHGLRDEGALESALVAAENREYYENADLATCAATYAYHLTQTHAFIDGNKRIAAAVSEIFLELNGARLNTTNEQIVRLFWILLPEICLVMKLNTSFCNGLNLEVESEILCPSCASKRSIITHQPNPPKLGFHQDWMLGLELCRIVGGPDSGVRCFFNIEALAVASLFRH